MRKVFINFCSSEDLLTVPGIGKDFARRILLLRKAYHGQLTPQNFAIFKNHVKNPALVDEVLQYFDFAPCFSKTPSLSNNTEG